MGRLVGIMLAAGLAAATGVSAAAAAGTGAKLWDGTLVVTDATEQCAPMGDVIGTLRALYRPHLKASDPKAAVIVQTDDLSHIIVIRAVSNTSNMQGTGDYCGIDFDASKGESSVWLGGTYTISVVPQAVTTATNEVRVSGIVRKFANIPGCVIKFRAAFERRP